MGGPIFADARAAAIGPSVSDIFNQQLRVDANQALKVASIISNDPSYNRPPDRWIYLFNIAPVDHVRHRPVDFPTIKIRACPPGEPFVMAMKIGDPVHYKMVSPDTGQPSFVSLDARRFACDLVNAANLTTDMWAGSLNPELDQMHGGGDDLARRGVFWTFNEAPTAEELSRSRGLMERHYRELVRQAAVLASDPKTAREVGAEHHLAADYLHVNESWHVRTQVQQSCPNCGEMVNPGIAYHASSVGAVCVIDWKRTVAAGIKKREDVPVEARWWTEPEEPSDAKERFDGRFRKKAE